MAWNLLHIKGRETMFSVFILASLLLSSVAAQTFTSTARNALDKFIHDDDRWSADGTGISTTNGSYLVFFRGHSVVLSYHFQADTSIEHQAWLDGVLVNAPMNITSRNASVYNGTVSISGARIDHQLRVDVSAGAVITLDSLNITYNSTTPLSTLYGNQATSVPLDAGMLDDQDPLILRSNGWENRTSDAFAGNGTLSTTSTPGSWMAAAMSGKGAAFWIYGMMGTSTSFIKIEVYSYHRSDPINVTEVVRVGGGDNGTNLATPLYQVPLYKLDGFSVNTYYLVKLTLLEGSFSLDYIRSGTKFQPFTSLQTYENGPETATPETIIILVSTIIPISSVLATVGLFLWWRRRHRRNRVPVDGAKQNFVGRPIKPSYVISPYGTTDPSQTTGTTGKGGTRTHEARTTLERQENDSIAEMTSIRSTESPGDVETSLLFSTFPPSTDNPHQPSGATGGGEEEEQPIAMTHEELAVVFSRATELRALRDRVAEYGYDEDRRKLEERKESEGLEALARQLVGLE